MFQKGQGVRGAAAEGEKSRRERPVVRSAAAAFREDPSQTVSAYQSYLHCRVSSPGYPRSAMVFSPFIPKSKASFKVQAHIHDTVCEVMN